MNAQKTKDWFINNSLTILTLLFPIITATLPAVIGFITNSLNPLNFILIVVITLFSIVFLIKTIWNITSYKSYHYPWLKIRNNYNYEIMEKKITYKRTANDVLQYSRYMNIKACSSHVSYVFDKYIWTGNTTDAYEIEPSQGIINIENKSRIGIWRYFMIELGYKTPAIAKLLMDDGIQLLFPYKRPMTKKGFFKKYKYVYDEQQKRIMDFDTHRCMGKPRWK